MDFNIRPPPPRKRRKLDVPAHVLCHCAKKERQKELMKVLRDIEKLLQSKHNVFIAGHSGLQAYQARAVQSYLQMVVHNGRKSFDASKRAAESQGSAAKWGGRLVRSWAKQWKQDHQLPDSHKGHHVKAYTLLSDPAVCAELHSYVRWNKWVMNPSKLAEFNQNNLVSTTAKEYLQHVIDKEMPQGLKKYKEVKLFPHIHLKPGRGITPYCTSMASPRRILVCQA